MNFSELSYVRTQYVDELDINGSASIHQDIISVTFKYADSEKYTIVCHCEHEITSMELHNYGVASWSPPAGYEKHCIATTR